MLSLLLASTIFIVGSNVANGAGLTGLHTWGTKADDGASMVAIDQVGNVFVTGGTDEFGSGLSQVLLLKYGSNGSLIWQKVWGGNGGDSGLDVAVDALGNAYVTGLTRSFNSGNNDQAFLLKFNSTGDLVWQKAWGNFTNGFTQGNSVAVDSTGHVYVSVSLGFINGTGSLVVLRLNTGGVLLWQKAWNAYPSQNGLGMTVDSADNIYVTGYSTGYAVLVKLNSTGGLQWQRGWLADRANGTTATSIVTDFAGNVDVGGFSFICSNPYCSYNATVSKFQSNGSISWQRAWKDSTQGFYPDTRISGVAVDGSGDIYATGANGAFLMKLDSFGNLLKLTEANGGAIVGSGVAVDASGTPVTVGSIYGPASKYHAIVLNPVLGTQLPQVMTPAGTLQDLHYPLLNLTGTVIDVSGSTSYAGGTDVFLNFGLTFPILALSPPQIILILGSVMTVFLIFSRKCKRRSLDLDV